MKDSFPPKTNENATLPAYDRIIEKARLSGGISMADRIWITNLTWLNIQFNVFQFLQNWF